MILSYNLPNSMQSFTAIERLRPEGLYLYLSRLLFCALQVVFLSLLSNGRLPTSTALAPFGHYSIDCSTFNFDEASTFKTANFC
jgi:hypothetical protein